MNEIAEIGIGAWMDVVDDIYMIKRNHDTEDQRLSALKEYISSDKPLNEQSLLALFVDDNDVPDSWTYEVLKRRLLTIVVAKQISQRYSVLQEDIEPYERTQIEKFFESITEEKQDVYELCKKFDLTWDTVKNFSRHDLHAKGRGIVKSKTDKLTKITYVYRDINKRFYGRVDTHNAMAFSDDLLKEYPLKNGDLDLDSFD